MAQLDTSERELDHPPTLLLLLLGVVSAAALNSKALRSILLPRITSNEAQYRRGAITALPCPCPALDSAAAVLRKKPLM